ncbi:MAG: hypothetical protein MUC49_03465 [Raineya sp.]|jgi:hypothetical protein|nr:hypothetical protein [Raineya sp.]
MKRIILSAAVVASLAFGGCKNKNADNPVPVPTGKATITGLATVDLDLNQAGRQGSVPAGTKVTVILSTEDLVLNPSGGVTYADKAYDTTIGADGRYSIEVDAVDKPFTVSVRGGDFEANRVPAGGGAAVRVKFSVSATDVTVYKGGSFIQDLAY